MKITADHVRAFGYWRTPARLRALAPKMGKPDIDALVNAHAGLKLDTVQHNALHLVRMRLKNGDDCLGALGLSNWDNANIPRRSYLFARWQRKLWRSLGCRWAPPYFYPSDLRERARPLLTLLPR